MSKRSFIAPVLIALALAGCGSSSSSTPATTPSPSPTPNSAATTATVVVSYDGNPDNSVPVYANEAPSGCPGSTQITGSTLTAITGVPPNPAGQATITGLASDQYYTFFFVTPNGAIVSLCNIAWTYADIDLTYP